jgi:hypothetical protein
MIVAEVVARERAILPAGFVEHRDVGFDAVFMDQPAEHLSRSIGGVRGQTLRVKTKALPGTLDHRLGCCHFGLPDRRGGFHINDDGMVEISISSKWSFASSVG